MCTSWSASRVPIHSRLISREFQAQRPNFGSTARKLSLLECEVCPNRSRSTDGPGCWRDRDLLASSAGPDHEDDARRRHLGRPTRTPRVPVVVPCPRHPNRTTRTPAPAPHLRMTLKHSRGRTRLRPASHGELEPSRGFPRSSRIPRLWSASPRCSTPGDQVEWMNGGGPTSNPGKSAEV